MHSRGTWALLQDSRFNRDIDKLTGYRTRTLLCMPIKDCTGDVIGVAQVINKLGGESQFTIQDEEIFAGYLQFCGIGLRNAQLYEKSQLEVRRNQVSRMLTRHRPWSGSSEKQGLPAFGLDFGTRALAYSSTIGI